MFKNQFLPSRQAERRGVDAHSDFEAVSRLVKIEFARFDIERMEDIKCMLERYLDGMILRQKEVGRSLCSP